MVSRRTTSISTHGAILNHRPTALLELKKKINTGNGQPQEYKSIEGCGPR